MNHDHIFEKLHAPAVLLVVHQENVAGLLRKFVVAALKRIVEGFGNLKEIIASGDDLPVSRHFDFVEKRNELIEHLRDSPADRGGVHHFHRLAFQFLREKTRFINVRGADDVFVVVQTRRRNGCRWRFPGPRLLAPFLAALNGWS